MPVTALENEIRGHELWGLPKVLEEIDLTVQGRDYVTTVKDEGGNAYLEFRVPMDGQPLSIDNETFLYSVLRGTTYRSPSHALGQFSVSKWPETLVLPLWALQSSDGDFLTLGDSPDATALKDLEIAPRPFQVRFSAGTESVFDLPDAQLDSDGKAVDPTSYE
jgi:hypothetical protein